MNDLVSPAPHPTLEELFALELEWFYSTKEELSQSDVLIGLLDHGLLSEKVPPCFSTAGLAAIVSETMGNLLEEEDQKRRRTRS